MDFREGPLENMVVDSKFWQDKKVLVTGHSGFKGSWLSLWLQMLGADITGYAIGPPTNPSLFETAGVEEGIKSLTGDIRNLDLLVSVVGSVKPEIIIHMAAQSLVRYSYTNPVETYSANVMGTVNILEAARLTRCAKVILIVTSDKCYENKEWVWGYRENEPLGGYDPYSSSKGCAELVAAAYRRSFFSNVENGRYTAIATVRAGNVIGGGDWAEDRLIPDIMKFLLRKSPAIIRNPGSVRPWQYVLEPLRGYLMLIEKLWVSGSDFSGAWNFGPDEKDSKPVSWVVENLTALWGNGARWELASGCRPYEALHLELNSSKARNQIGWVPKLSLPVALEWVVKWYRSYQQNMNMRELTKAEILRYENI